MRLGILGRQVYMRPVSQPPAPPHSFRLSSGTLLAAFFLLMAAYFAATSPEPLLKATDSQEKVELTLAKMAPLGMSRAKVEKLFPKLGVGDSSYRQSAYPEKIQRPVQTPGGLITALIPAYDPTARWNSTDGYVIMWNFDAQDRLTRFAVIRESILRRSSN
jgi:hypothetical protein